MTNEKSDSKTDGIFELIMVENLRRSINGYSAYGTVHILGNIHKYNKCFTYTIWWCGIDRWCGRMLLDQNTDVVLTDDVTTSYGTEMLMWCWLIMCTNQSKLAMWRNPERMNYFHLMAMIYLCIYKKRVHLPNLTPLNPFSSSIFYNSLSILYFLHILIKLSFYSLFNYKWLVYFKLGLKVKAKHDPWA